VAVLNRALAAAEAIVGTEATQAEVDHAYNMLNVAIHSLTNVPREPVSEYKFDFGSGDVAEGYIRVDAKHAYIEGNGYGFADTSLTVDEERETGDALKGDFVRVNGTSFLVEMEPGDYRVTLTIGDPQESTNVGIVMEQMQKLPVTTIASGQYQDFVYDIALIDGVFHFEFSGNAPKINALKIEKLPERAPGDKPVIYLASDSTVANYAEVYRPQAGWGERLGDYFDLTQISIDNRAVGGLSSKTFLTLGYLNDLLLDIRPGDYLFMQWSHNDSTPVRPERYVTPEQFKEYLMLYIDGARQRGATPILVTPVNRRDFTGDILNKSFPEYVQAMKEVAQESGTLLIDLNQASWEYFQELGPEGTKSIFLWVGTTEDNTHLQMNGAIKVAEMVAKLVKELNIPLSELVTIEDEEPELPPGVWAEATISGPASAYLGHAVELSIGVAEVQQPFNVMDVVVHYNPAVLEFETTESGDGLTLLADSAVAAKRNNVHVLAAAVRPNEGLIRVILVASGDGVEDSGDLFALLGRVKSDAAVGDVTVRLTQTNVSYEGEEGSADVSRAIHTIAISEEPQQPPVTDKSALNAVISQAQSKLDSAVEGHKLGQYEVGAKAELQSAIAAANAVYADIWSTQAQVDAATVALQAAIEAFDSKFITLVEGQTQITIRDLSILAKYFGITSSDPNWNEVAAADLFDEGVIDIRVLAAVAKMILSEW
jgi:lysophospholipase L1-like esterase